MKYIFDYGGTLDTRGNHWGRVIWHAYEHNAMPISWEQFREAYVYAERTLGRNPIVGPTWTFKKLLDVKLRLQMEYLFTKGYWQADKKAFTKMQLNLLDELYDHTRQVTAESRAVLQQLNAQQNDKSVPHLQENDKSVPLLQENDKSVPLLQEGSGEVAHKPSFVLVSNFYGNISVVLKEFGLDTFFPTIIESAVVGIRKPDARIFSLGVEALGVKPEEVTVVGDSVGKDIIPARSIGCHTVWFKGESWDDKVEDETIPERIITSLSELLLGQ